MSQVRELIHRGAHRLHTAGIKPARRETEWLLSRLLGLHSVELYLDEPPVSDEVARRFFTQIESRAAGIPLQYLLGETEFFGATLAVSSGVFIPRPETETIIAVAIEALRKRAGRLSRPLRLLDLGTGSGAMAIALARALPACVVVGVEVSWNALLVARQNIRRHRLEARVQLVQGRWLSAMRGSFDGVVSNPPYIPTARMNQLPLDVRQEPRVSLDGGEHGMRDALEVLAASRQALDPGGLLVLECGEEQVETLCRTAAAWPWVATVNPIVDLAGRPRGLHLTRR